MSLVISPALAEARVAATRDFIDLGTLPGRIRFYGNTQPAAGATPGTSPLAEITLTKPCGSIADAVLTLTQADAGGDLILANGAAVWARMVNGNGDFVMDGDVSDETGSGSFKVAGTTGTALYAGGSLLLGTTALG